MAVHKIYVYTPFKQPNFLGTKWAQSGVAVHKTMYIPPFKQPNFLGTKWAVCPESRALRDFRAFWQKYLVIKMQ